MSKFSQHNFSGQKALIRVDFNVPLDGNFMITDDSRMKASLPTITKILADGGAVILMSHLGRPKGKKNPDMSLMPAAVRLAELLNKPVTMASDCIGDEVEKTIAAMQPGQIVLLENLRFYNEEEKNDPEFFARWV